jgi:DNA-binding SARP family transcriptional activator/streptogramin lyase
MEFRVLGPLEVDDGERRIAIASGKQGALLAYLLVHRDTTVSIDRLVDELWASGPPPTAAKIVRNLVSELRKLLGSGDGVALVTEAGGYRLRVSADQIDAGRFEVLSAQGRRLVERGETRRAAEVLREALGLWRGAAYSGLGREAFAEAESARLEQVRLACLEARIEADLALGRHTELVSELEALVTREPFRERFREQLMLALYRSGRQADALAAYRDARRTFSRELGIEPGRALQELERAILAQDPTLELPERPHVAALRRRGGVLVALGAAALLAAAAAVALTLDDRDAPKGLAALTPNSIGAIDPETGRIVAQVPLGAGAARLAGSQDAVWALSTTERTLYRIDAARRELTGSARIDDVVADVAAAGDEAWVVHAGSSGTTVVTRFAGDQATLLRLDSFEPGIQLLGAGGTSFGPADDRIAVGDDTVWVTTSAQRPGGVAVLDRRSGRIRARLPGYVYGLVLGTDATWLVAEQQLRRVDTRAWQVDLEITLPSPGVAVAVAVGERAVWALTVPVIQYGAQGTRRTGQGIVTRVDPETEAVSTTIPIGGVPDSIAAGLGSVWITDLDRQELVRVDPHTNTVVDRIELGARPTSITLAGGLVWVAVI